MRHAECHGFLSKEDHDVIDASGSLRQSALASAGKYWACAPHRDVP